MCLRKSGQVKKKLTCKLQNKTGLVRKKRKVMILLTKTVKQLLWMALRETGLYLTTDHGPLVKKVVCLF